MAMEPRDIWSKLDQDFRSIHTKKQNIFYPSQQGVRLKSVVRAVFTEVGGGGRRNERSTYLTVILLKTEYLKSTAP